MTTLNAESYIVIDDGQFKYPVRRADVERVGKTARDLHRMDGEAYSAWCQDVPMDASHGDAGTQGCIDYCNALLEAGAESWNLTGPEDQLPA